MLLVKCVFALRTEDRDCCLQGRRFVNSGSIKHIRMIKSTKIVIVFFIAILANLSVQAKANTLTVKPAPTTAKTAAFDWSAVMDAIIYVESRGNARAVSGNSCGAMQITPILVKECNNILRQRKSKKRYTLADRFSVEKSKEMFMLIQSEHNPQNNVERAIRTWNGGNHYSVRRTQRYYERVMARMRN